jgi:hypothetical protein
MEVTSLGKSFLVLKHESSEMKAMSLPGKHNKLGCPCIHSSEKIHGPSEIEA